MPVITCPSCNARLNLPTTPTSVKVRCPKCQTVIATSSVAAPARQEVTEASPFDFASGPAESARGSAESLDFSDSHSELDLKRERRRVAAPAAFWLRISGIVYLVLAGLYALRVVYVMTQARGGGAFVVFVIGFFVVSLTVGLGIFLGTAAKSLARGDKAGGMVMAACILAIIAGAIALIVGLLTVVSALRLLSVPAGGEWTEESWAFALFLGLLYLGVAACSLFAAIKGLLVPGAQDRLSREPDRDREPRRRRDLDS